MTAVINGAHIAIITAVPTFIFVVIAGVSHVRRTRVGAIKFEAGLRSWEPPDGVRDWRYQEDATFDEASTDPALGFGRTWDREDDAALERECSDQDS